MVVLSVSSWGFVLKRFALEKSSFKQFYSTVLYNNSYNKFFNLKKLGLK